MVRISWLLEVVHQGQMRAKTITHIQNVQISVVKLSSMCSYPLDNHPLSLLTSLFPSHTLSLFSPTPPLSFPN